MSTSRGNNVRKRPQKHQNRSAFKNDLHDTSQKTKFLNALEVTGVCQRCKDIIEWKIKYKKYKALTAPRKCVNCEQKTIKHAYHVFCTKCGTEKNVCAKCCKPRDNQETSELIENNETTADIKTMLKVLPERKRRTILRFLSKQQDADSKISPEIKLQIDDMIAKMDNINSDDDDDFCGFSDDHSVPSDNDEN